MLDFSRLFAALCLLCSCLQPQAFAQPHVLRVDFQNNVLYGMPVHWGRNEAALLESNGLFHIFKTREVTNHSILDAPFRPQSLVEARVDLQRELGSGFDILISGPYVIAAPVGEADRWKRRFNTLLAGYTRYFEVRGWPVRRADFPLIVIVFADRQQFLRYANTQTGQLPNLAVGSYFPRTNRCILYQIAGSRGVNWSETESTIVHEAVHQLAYNTGLHERLFDNPTWFVEGVATMFEQPAVYDLSVQRSTIGNRMNPGKVRDLQKIGKTPGQLEFIMREIVVSDEFFKHDPLAAYAVAWGMVFYLSERMPSQFRTYIELQNRRRFGEYKPMDRERDFQQAFGQPAESLAPALRRLYGESNAG